MIEDLDELINFYERNKNSFKFFSPHGFTREALYKIINDRVLDLYYVVIIDDKIIGYCMLRGMDEGFSTPSLGLAVDNNFSGKGISDLLMLFMEKVCKVRGYKKIRLKVHKDNLAAVSLYKRCKYILDQYDDIHLLGVKEL